MRSVKTIISALLLLHYGAANAQYNFSKTTLWLHDHVAEIGGRAILMVYKDGKVIYCQAFNQMTPRQKMITNFVTRRQGKANNLEDFTPATREPVASCSKWYSAALVMTFVDDGSLKLDDTVGKYLPILTQHGKGGITVSDCLSHLTGIESPPIRENIGIVKDAASMDEAIATIADLPIEGKHGHVFHYGNTGLQIAAAILEKISGKSFEALFAERITGPLNMKHTDFGKGKVALAAGGAISTPEDYLNFLVMILNKGVFGNKRILSEAGIAKMQINRRTADVKTGYAPAEAGDFGYGYGEWVMDSSTVSSPGLFGSDPWVNNDKKYAAFMMTYYIKSAGRHERYVTLKNLVDDAVTR